MNLRHTFSPVVYAKLRTLIGAATITLVLAPASISLAFVEVTETFDIGTGTRFDLFLDNDISRPKPGTMSSDPDTNPADDALINNAFEAQRTLVDGNGDIITNRFGFTNTNNAEGLGVGEFGGEFNWFDFGAVADTTIGGSLNVTDEVKILSTMKVATIGYENDQRIMLGYYNLPANPVGADFGRGEVVAGIGFVGDARFLLHINGNASGAIFVPGGYITNGPDDETGESNVFTVDLTLKFGPGLDDPNQTEAWFEGSIDGSVSGSPVSIPINQFTFSVGANVGNTINSFAIAQTHVRTLQDAYRRGVAWIDDLTYSVVSDLGVDTPNPARIYASDFNLDGQVDSLDLTDPILGWEARYGVDLFADDFLKWQREFGSGVSPLAATAAVPEPATLCSFFLMITVLASGRRTFRFGGGFGK